MIYEIKFSFKNVEELGDAYCIQEADSDIKAVMAVLSSWTPPGEITSISVYPITKYFQINMLSNEERSIRASDIPYSLPHTIHEEG